jgi:hypothetical protein
MITGSHAYADEDTYALKVTITDSSDNATTSVTGTAFVTDAALTAGSGSTLSAVQGNLFSGTLASFTDAFATAPASDFTAEVNWGDSSPVSTFAVSGSGGSYTVSGSHTWAQAGTFTVSVTILDKGGSKATVTDTATVTAAALPVTVSVSPNALTEGVNSGPVPVATFTDPDNNTNPSLYSANIA